jgi:5-methylcytosine-specific restriction enzyme A
MPIAPPRGCDRPACSGHAITGSAFCEKHQPVQDNRAADKVRYRREPWRAWYNNAPWQRLKAFMKNREPICRKCGRAKTEVIDHIIDHKGNPELFYDPDNLQGLCKPCHDAKTGATSHGQGKPHKHADYCLIRDGVCTCDVNDASVPYE